MRSRSPEPESAPAAAGAALPTGFWPRVATAKHRLLLLDYDGTLAPLTMDRTQARPPARATALLARIAASPSSRVAVVSGRTLADLVRLLEHPPYTLVGEHGWDIGRPGGGVTRHPLPEGCVDFLDRVEKESKALGWGAHLERKRSGLVLHTRGLPAGTARALERDAADLWRGLHPGPGLRITPLTGGMELRAARRDKGTAVGELRAESPPESLAVYLGDDDTDEDAFRAVSEGGFGIRVGPDDRPSLATGRLASVEETVRFLERWAERSRPPDLPGRDEP